MAMKSEFVLPYYTAQSGAGVGMFNTTMGKLQRQLYKGEYDIFKYAPIFESDFIQITKRGEVIDVHNRVRMVTVGIACTSPILPLPDVMLLARPAVGSEDVTGRTKGRRKSAKSLELTRLLPLKFVRISVHDREKQQLRLKFATGRSCYLQLCPPINVGEDLFAYWEKLIYILRPPVDSNSSTYAIPAEDIMCMPMFDEDDKTSLAVADIHAKGDQDQVSIRSLHMVPDAYVTGEGTQHDSYRTTSTPDSSTPKTKPKDLATGATAEYPGQGSSGTSDRTGAATSGSPETSTKESPENKSPEHITSNTSSLSPEGIVNLGGEPTSQTVRAPGKNPAGGPFISTLQSDKAGGHKERRERRERREKNRGAGRTSRHHRTSESRHKTAGDKMSRKSPGRRTVRDDKKGKGRSSPRGSKHSSAHKGVSHTPITKDSRTSHKSGRSLSTSSGSTNKKLNRISSFLRNVRANLTTKGAISLRSRDVDIAAKTVERTNVKAIMEKESGQGVEIVGSVISEIMETVTFETH